MGFTLLIFQHPLLICLVSVSVEFRITVKIEVWEVRPWWAGAVQHMALTIWNSEVGPGSYSQVQHVDDPDPAGLLRRIRWDKRAYNCFNTVWIIRPGLAGNNYTGMLQELKVDINKNLKKQKRPHQPMNSRHMWPFLQFFLFTLKNKRPGQIISKACFSFNILFYNWL